LLFWDDLGWVFVSEDLPGGFLDNLDPCWNI
jgi:hypothetical protein